MVAIPDFDAGAMENWGLVTYRDVFLLYSELSSSARSRQQVAEVIAHELAHQVSRHIAPRNLLLDFESG